MLKFSKANAKIEALKNVDAIASFLHKSKVYSLDLLSGYSCPYARNCLSRAIVENGKRYIKDGPDTEFRCFSATQELIFPAVYNARKYNFDLLRTSNNKAQLIADSMPSNLGVCRIHVGGDFFNEEYMLAWADIAKQFPNKLFYAYTKSLPFWVRHKKEFYSIPNFVLTASYGGRFDNLIKENKLRWVRVVYSEARAKNWKLEIDHDDSSAADPSKRNKNFALLIHGIQPGGTKASKALQQLKKDNVKHSYSRKAG
jgi:hypothetical protein